MGLPASKILIPFTVKMDRLQNCKLSYSYYCMPVRGRTVLVKPVFDMQVIVLQKPGLKNGKDKHPVQL